MSDNPSFLIVKDGLAALRDLGTVQDENGVQYPQHVIRVDGTPLGSASPMPVQSAPFPLKSCTKGTMGVAATIIVPVSTTRRWLIVYNRSATGEIQDIGASNVTVGGGIPLYPGAGFMFDGAGAAGPIYGITTVPNSAFSFVEG